MRALARPWTAVCVAAALLLAGCGDDGDDGQTTATPSGFAAIAGEWSGTLNQADTKPFPIRVRIESESDPTANVVRYGGEIDCAGTWRLFGAVAAPFLFREVIDRGRGGRCKGTGTVRLMPTADPDRLDYEFRGGGVESEGVLQREG